MGWVGIWVMFDVGGDGGRFGEGGGCVEEEGEGGVMI